MIIRPDFASPRQSPRGARAEDTRAEEKPALAWRICPVTNRPVMVWTLPEPRIMRMPASARA
jgi:hypothetical protein